MRKKLICYPGHHGPEALVRLSPNRMMRFTAGQVREVSERVVQTLMLLSGYFEALRLEQAAERYGVDAKALAASSAVRTADYAGETVIVLDRPTARFLRSKATGAASPSELSTVASPAPGAEAAPEPIGEAPATEPKPIKKTARSKK